MISIINTITIRGLDAIKTEIQVSIFSGVPSFQIVGLAGKTINEAMARIRATINTLGIDLPPKKIIVNLSPTDLLKEGNHYDLPIIMAILMELEVISNDNFHHEDYLVIGEVSLNGSIKSVDATLIASLFASQNNLTLICPHENGSLARISGSKKILAPKSLMSLISHLNAVEFLTMPDIPNIDMSEHFENDFSCLNGTFQQSIRRALEIAIAGGHSLMMIGPPGCGKTYSVECARSIMPRMTEREIIEILMIESTYGNLISQSIGGNIIKLKRPFRNPHHSASSVSIVGGGRKIEPGEITLAHNGILFMDEFAEFNTATLDALREPLETSKINIARAEKHVTYPANFQLIAALNPCKCGYFGDPKRQCSRAPTCAQNYQKKISGPLMDRIDIFVQLSGRDFYEGKKEYSLNIEPLEAVRLKIENARRLQYDRYKKYFDSLQGVSSQDHAHRFEVNGKASAKNLQEILDVAHDVKVFLSELVNKGRISMRGFNRILKVARTIADLEASPTIEDRHASEAYFFRKT